MKHLSSSKPYVMPESVRKQVYGPVRAMPQAARATHERSLLRRLRHAVGVAIAAAIAGCAPSTSDDADMANSASLIASAAAQEAMDHASANYAGANYVEIAPEVYRICDGKTGRMIFVYQHDAFRKASGGIAILTGQSECR